MATKLKPVTTTRPLALSVNGNPFMGDMMHVYGAVVLLPLIYAMVLYEIPQKLVASSKTVDDIVKATNLRRHKVEVDLGVLYRFGLFDRDEAGRYSNNEHTERLLMGRVIPPLVCFMGSEEIWATWGKHAEGLTTDASAFALANEGVESMPYFMQHREAAGPFQKMLEGQTTAQAAAIVDAYDFSNAGTIVDIGCGHGTLSTVILGKFPGTKAILFDTPQMLPITRQVCEHSPVADRLTFVEGDFFKEVPSGDTLVLKLVPHDWDDEKAIMLLRNCRKALRPGGKVLIAEHLRTSEGPCFFDILNPTMTTIQEGFEREDYRSIVEPAGLKIVRIIPTKIPTGMSIMECVAA